MIFNNVREIRWNSHCLVTLINQNMFILFCKTFFLKLFQLYIYKYIMEFKDLLFLIYRMMPFIMVAFLVISSLFSGELSGFLVLVGLIISSMITIGISKMEFVQNGITSSVLNECSLLTLNDTVLSNLPLSTHTFAFIFGYFIYVIVTNKLVVKNALLIAMLTVLVFVDVVYNFNSCAQQFVVIPLIVGVFSGVIWALMIGKQNQMMPQADSASKCSVTKGLYKCKIKRTGQVISG